MSQTLIDEYGLSVTPRFALLETMILDRDASLYDIDAAPAHRSVTNDLDVVGREREVDEVLAALDASANAVVHVHGEAGIGKSTVLRRAAAELARRSRHTVVVVGANAADVPLGAVGDMLAALGEKDSPSPSSPQDAAGRLLAALGRHDAITVILDDADHLDQDSSAAIGRVVRFDRHARWVVGSRSARLASLAAFADRSTLTEAVSIELGPLTEAATSTLARRWLSMSASVDEVEVAMVVRRSGGNPFLAAVLARGQRSDEVVPTAALDHLHRLTAELDDATRDLLTYAALEARPTIDLRTIAVASGLDLDGAVDAAERAIAAGLLTEAAGLVFRHDVAREAIIASTSGVRLQTCHLALADALIGLGATDPIRIAGHLRAAGPIAPAADTLQWVVREAYEALRLGAALTAFERFQEASRLAAVGALGVDTVLRWELAGADALARAGRWDESLTSACAVAARALEAGLADLFAEAAVLSAGPGLPTGEDRQKALALLDEAWAWMEDDPHGRLRLAEAVARVVSTAPPDVVARLERDARDVLERRSDDRDDDTVLALLGLRVLSWRGEMTPRERIGLSARAVVRSRRAIDPMVRLEAQRCHVADLFVAADPSLDTELARYAADAEQSMLAYYCWTAARVGASLADARGDAALVAACLLRAERHGAAIDDVQRATADIAMLVGRNIRTATLASLADGAQPSPELDDDVEPTFLLGQLAIAAAVGQPSDPAMVGAALGRVLHGSPRPPALVLAALALTPARGFETVAHTVISLLTPFSGGLCIVEGGVACFGPFDRYLIRLHRLLGDHDAVNMLRAGSTTVTAMAPGWSLDED